MDDFLNKIKSLDEIVKLTKTFPEKKLSYIHGVFDIVCQSYETFDICKKKADILIVSTTNDKFIKKGRYRPLCTYKNIRLQNLAAFEFVDYVFVDNNKEPYGYLNLNQIILLKALNIQKAM